jgi:deoxyribodipyrimidine photo-lyase
MPLRAKPFKPTLQHTEPNKPRHKDMRLFEPTKEAALAGLSQVDSAAYARTRNAVDGAVTRLSPYLTHGLLSLREVYEAVHAKHPLPAQHKLVFELGWRAYWHHVWAHLGDGVHQSIHPGVLPDGAYHQHMPADILEARTGVNAIDLAVRELYETGYVHNHARMWLASYVVHLRKVHWHVGAKWMLGHLLDGDIASNHLSWQWVAGTGSNKPYLFNADNVAKYAPAQWHSPGTVIDTSYEALDQIARSAQDTHQSAGHLPALAGVDTPALLTSPPDECWTKPSHVLAAGRDVWLVHPWSISAEPPSPSGLANEPLVIGIGFPQCHAHTPWSARRWRFATDGMRAQTPVLWWASVEQIAEALGTAHSVQWQPNPHINGALNELQMLLHAKPHGPVVMAHVQPCLFEPVAQYCKSFSQWWRHTRIA